MKIGITGHQDREGIEWAWVSRTISLEMVKLKPVESVLTSLAAGSDQVFADVALTMNIPILVIIPVLEYEGFFEGHSLEAYKRLLSLSTPVNLHSEEDPETAFFEAGKFIVNHCDVMFAVWDGEMAEGVGGTGDVVQYAQTVGRRLVHINPISESVQRIPDC